MASEAHLSGSAKRNPPDEWDESLPAKLFRTLDQPRPSTEIGGHRSAPPTIGFSDDDETEDIPPVLLDSRPKSSVPRPFAQLHGGGTAMFHSTPTTMAHRVGGAAALSANAGARDSTPRYLAVETAGGKRKLNMSGLSDSMLSASTYPSPHDVGVEVGGVSDSGIARASPSQQIERELPAPPTPLPLSFDLPVASADLHSSPRQYVTSRLHVSVRSSPALDSQQQHQHQHPTAAVGGPATGQAASALPDSPDSFVAWPTPGIPVNYSPPSLSSELPSSDVRLSHGSEFHIPDGAAAPDSVWDQPGAAAGTAATAAVAGEAGVAAATSGVASGLATGSGWVLNNLDDLDVGVDTDFLDLARADQNPLRAERPDRDRGWRKPAARNLELDSHSTAGEAAETPGEAEAWASPLPSRAPPRLVPQSEPPPRREPKLEVPQSYSRYGRLRQPRSPAFEPKLPRAGRPGKAKAKASPKVDGGAAAAAKARPRSALNALSPSEANTKPGARGPGTPRSKAKSKLALHADASSFESPARPARVVRVPQSASRAGVAQMAPASQPWLKTVKLPYDPFYTCGKHDLCRQRAELSMADIAAGWYYSMDREGDNFLFRLAQAKKADGTPYTLSEEVEESPRGIANMCQLHMIRAFGCAPSVTRPLLCPDKAIKVTPPVIRIIESKRYFTGKFFNERTACQCDDCILVVFPKSHRGDVRLQLKTWTEGEGMSGRAHTGSTSDVKAHVLSYLVWIYGLSDQPAAEMGKWPPYLSAHCAYGRGARKGARKGGDDDDLVRLDEFLCINPMHYVPPEEQAGLQRRVIEACQICVKDRDALPGEKTRFNGKSFCYCFACQDAAGI